MKNSNHTDSSERTKAWHKQREQLKTQESLKHCHYAEEQYQETADNVPKRRQSQHDTNSSHFQ